MCESRLWMIGSRWVFIFTGFRFFGLVLSFGGGFLALSAWLALEAAVFHPDHSLTELLPLSGFAGGGGAGALFAGRNWLRLLENVAVALGWGVAPLALAGLFLGRRSPLPLGPLLAWVLFLLLLQVQFPQTAIRFRVAYSIPVLLLCLRALPAGRRPGVSALVMGLLALVGFFSALPALRTFVTLPHAFHLRAERMDRHAGNKDVLLFIGPDTAYGNWLLHGRRIVLSLKDLLDRETLADLIERRDHAAVVETGRIAPLLERFLVPAVRAAAAQDRDFFVVPYPGQLPAFTGLREKGLTVEVVEELPPGRSHSQFDPFGWRISPQQGPSQRKEHLLRLSAR